VELARCGAVFPVSVVVGAAVPAAVCRWGLCPRCSGVGRCFSGVYIYEPTACNNCGAGGGAVASGLGFKVPVPKCFDFEFPIIKAKKLLDETRSCS